MHRRCLCPMSPIHGSRPHGLASAIGTRARKTGGLARTSGRSVPGTPRYLLRHYAASKFLSVRRQGGIPMTAYNVYYVKLQQTPLHLAAPTPTVATYALQPHLKRKAAMRRNNLGLCHFSPCCCQICVGYFQNNCLRKPAENMRTLIYHAVRRVDFENGGFRSFPAEVGGAAPNQDIAPASPMEHPVVPSNSAGLPVAQPIMPTNGSILGLEPPL